MSVIDDEIERQLDGASRELDALIAADLAHMWERIERDKAATLPANGIPAPDLGPGSAWRRVTAEEAITMRATQLQAWKTRMLDDIRAKVRAELRKL
jgi:hypothetical protein